MADYMSYMSKYDDFIKKFDQWGGEDLNDAEFAYYMEVQTRAYERLAEAAYNHVNHAENPFLIRDSSKKLFICQER